jgi:hypothetical protein
VSREGRSREGRREKEEERRKKREGRREKEEERKKK